MLKGKSSTSVVKFWMLQNPEGSGWISLLLSFSIPRDENIHPLWDKEGVMVLVFMKSWELFSCLKSENILSSYVKLLSYLVSCHGEIKTNFHLRTDLSINPPVFFFFFWHLFYGGWNTVLPKDGTESRVIVGGSEDITVLCFPQYFGCHTLNLNLEVVWELISWSGLLEDWHWKHLGWEVWLGNHISSARQ